AAFHDDAERHGYLGGETLPQVRDRVLPAIGRIVAAHPGGTVVVVGHGVVNRVLLAHWLGLPLRYSRQLPQDNAGYSVVEFRAAAPSPPNPFRWTHPRARPSSPATRAANSAVRFHGERTTRCRPGTRSANGSVIASSTSRRRAVRCGSVPPSIAASTRSASSF